MHSPTPSSLARTTARARVALAAERASDAALRRQRLADTAKLERDLEAWLPTMFAVQNRTFLRELRGVNPASDPDVVAAYRRAADRTRGARRAGIAPSMRAAYFLGYMRAAERLAPALRKAMAREALFKAPPDPLTLQWDMQMGDFKLRESMFGTPNQDAIRYMTTSSGTFVSGLDDRAIERLGAVMSKARADGLSSQKTGAAIAAAFPGQFTGAAAQAHIENRAHLIAITEMSAAYNAGNDEAIERLSSLGAVFRKEWLAVGDTRTCPTCANNEAIGELDVDEEFPASETMSAPAHPGCRCTVTYRPVSLAELAGMPNAYTPSTVTSGPYAGQTVGWAAPPVPATPTVMPAPPPAGLPPVPPNAPAVPTPGQSLTSLLPPKNLDRGDFKRFGDNWHGPNDPLSQDVRNSYQWYSGSEYRSFNAYFRGQATPPSLVSSFNDRARDIDSAMVPVPQDVLVWRGVPVKTMESIFKPLPGEDLGDAMKRVGTFSDGSYSSTSVDEDISKGFGGVLFRLRVPAGTRGRAMDRSLSTASGEVEILWERGRQYRITSITKIDDDTRWRKRDGPANYIVEAEWLP